MWNSPGIQNDIHSGMSKDFAATPGIS